MPSNLRAKSIEGHVTDSAGNVLRNAEIVIKMETPSRTFPVDTINADDDGYFRSRPLPSGKYDIYESGIRVTSTIHVANQNPIQCYRASDDNYDRQEIQAFSALAASRQLNNYKTYIQIEPESIDIPVYGSSFPIYNKDITTEPGGSLGNVLYKASQFLAMEPGSRITTTRFDIEYFSPLTSVSSQYRRTRWAGVPAIKFFEDSRLVLPLDYYSVVPSMPKSIGPEVSDFPVDEVTFSLNGNLATVDNDNSNTDYNNFVATTSIGDIIKLTLTPQGGGTNIVWYGILDSNDGQLLLEKWLSSRFISEDAVGSYYVSRMEAFDALFQNISNIDEEVNERFTVVENVFAQDGATELYTYENYVAPSE